MQPLTVSTESFAAADEALVASATETVGDAVVEVVADFAPDFTMRVSVPSFGRAM